MTLQHGWQTCRACHPAGQQLRVEGEWHLRANPGYWGAREPKVIRSDNGKEFCGKAMVTWAHGRGAQLRLIELGKPSQNACIESFTGRLRDECFNEHWFPSLLHARTEIDSCRWEYNEERPQKALGGPTSTAYAK